MYKSEVEVSGLSSLRDHDDIRAITEESVSYSVSLLQGSVATHKKILLDGRGGARISSKKDGCK